MPPKFAVGWRACCVAVALLFSPAPAAEPKSPLLGASRQQVVDRLGEPKSAIVAGNREILFFPRERLVLRNGVVVEVEPLAEESAPRRPPAEQNVSPASPAASPSSPDPSAAPPPAPSPASSEGSPAAAPPAPASASPATSEPRLEIKSVRPQGAGTRATSKQETPAPAAPPAAELPKNTPAPVLLPPPRSPVSSGLTKKDSAPTKTVSEPEAEAPKAEDLAAAAGVAAKKEKAKASRRRLDEADLDEPTEAIFTGRTYAIAFVIIGGGLGYLLWQRRQRQLELDATAVSRTPFSAPVSTSAGARFTADLLGKLEWKRFEELVAAYYSKTGVVAARTKTGPSSPVHIKISWKGEPRPFACVQCIARSTGLIDVAPLQDLVAVLAAEDIRRGYVVTTGKFSVSARDLAEEKHITLLPGDIFLEKLNALPDAARSELMQEISTGDYTTPSCPKCEAKMVRSPDDSSLWRCETHREQTFPAN